MFNENGELNPVRPLRVWPFPRGVVPTREQLAKAKREESTPVVEVNARRFYSKVE